MQTRHYKKGETIFRTGEPSTEVFILTDGEVSVTLDDGCEIVRLHSGDIFGESGVLEKRARAANATATAATAVLVTPADTFTHAFGMDNDRALSLVKLLCRRLRTTSIRAAHADGPCAETATTAGSEQSPILLIPDNPRLEAEYGLTLMSVAHLPFQVGNRLGGGEIPVYSNRSCSIPARAEPELGAPHFEIARRGGLLGVHDLGSRTGTIVNGTVISRTSSASFVPLHPGMNLVIAGRAQSPFRFKVQVHGA
jgi:hypothetical protein